MTFLVRSFPRERRYNLALCVRNNRSQQPRPTHSPAAPSRTTLNLGVRRRRPIFSLGAAAFVPPCCVGTNAHAPWIGRSAAPGYCDADLTCRAASLSPCFVVRQAAHLGEKKLRCERRRASWNKSCEVVRSAPTGGFTHRT